MKRKWIAAVIWIILTAWSSSQLSAGTFRCCASEQDTLELYARSAVLMDGDSGRILYGKNGDEPLPMASTTKIMTCILALEQASEDTVCTVSSNAAAQPRVKLQMVEGDSFLLGDLLYSLMLESHNDTAVCIAENVAGSVEEFALLMNRKAEALGCTDTYFITPNGLDAEDEKGAHHTTAAELAGLLRYCIRESPKAEEFLRITRADSYSFSNLAGTRQYSCVNHNAFLHMMEGALSGKTGFTGNAGYCYTGALERDGRLLIVSLLACGWPDHKRYKWSDTKKLMEYGLEHYETAFISTEELELEAVPVERGVPSSVAVEAESVSCRLLLRADERLTKQIRIPDCLAAPVEEGQEIGCVEYSIDGVPYISARIRTAESSRETGFVYCLRQAAEQFLLPDSH